MNPTPTGAGTSTPPTGPGATNNMNPTTGHPGTENSETPETPLIDITEPPTDEHGRNPEDESDDNARAENPQQEASAGDKPFSDQINGNKSGKQNMNVPDRSTGAIPKRKPATRPEMNKTQGRTHRRSTFGDMDSGASSSPPTTPTSEDDNIRVIDESLNSDGVLMWLDLNKDRLDMCDLYLEKLATTGKPIISHDWSSLFFAATELARAFRYVLMYHEELYDLVLSKAHKIIDLLSSIRARCKSSGTPRSSKKNITKSIAADKCKGANKMLEG